MLEMNASQLIELLMKVNEMLVMKMGGQQMWDAMSDMDKFAAEAECFSELPMLSWMKLKSKMLTFLSGLVVLCTKI